MRYIKQSLLLIVGLLAALLITINTVNAATSKWPSSVPKPPDSTLRIGDLFTVVSRTNADTSSKYPQTVIITPYAKNQKGGIWSKQKLDLNNSFTYDMWLWLGDHNGTYGDDTAASDGIAFLLQNDSNQAIGTPGGGLGAYTWGVEKQTGYVKNALAIEMDSWWNNLDSSWSAEHFDYDVPQAAEKVGHTGFVQPRDTGKNSNLGHLGTVWYDTNNMLANAHWRLFTVKWEPNIHWQNGKRIIGGTLSYQFGANWNATTLQKDDSTILKGDKKLVIDDVTKFFGSTNNVYFGFTGSTGGAYNNFQAASMVKLPQQAKPVTINFKDATTGTAIANPVQLNGEIGENWNGADQRQNWIQYKNEWYQYTNSYTADTPDQKDTGQFSSTNSYNVTYQYKKQSPPANYALAKAVRNTTQQQTDWQTTTKASAGETVEYQLSYTNLTSISSGTITDKLPKGVTYQKGSLQIADPDNNWQYQPVDDTNFIQQSTVNFPYVIPAGSGFNLKLKATVDADTKTGQTIINQATAGDSAKTVSSNPASIEVTSSPYIGQFDKLVLNETQKETKYAKVTTGQAGDRVSYQLKYTVDNQSGSNLQSGLIKDQLPAGLKLVPNSIQAVYSDGTKVDLTNLTQLAIKPLSKGQSVTITFKADIEQLESGTLKNTADFSGQTTNAAAAPNEISNATINVQKAQPGHVYMRYIDRSTQNLITSAMAGQIEWIDVSGAVGQKVSDIKPGEQLAPKSITDWTPVSQVIRADANRPAEAEQTKIQKSDPVIDKQPQYYTYYYEPTAISISAPDKWQFGEFAATSKNTNYYLPGKKDAQGHPQPYQVAVNDYYGMADWRLNVQQSDQFRTTSENQPAPYELTDAQLQFTNVSAKRVNDGGNSEEQPAGQLTNLKKFNLPRSGQGQVDSVMAYAKSGHYANESHLATDANQSTYDNPGWNVYALQFGNQEQADYSIALHIPETTQKHKALYKTRLTWTLSTGPQ